MDPNGKNAFKPKDQVKAREEYQKLRQAEVKAPEGQREVYVTTPPDEKYPQIFVAYADGTASQITDLVGMNSDPVWSPSGHWIAFVSSQPGNDEIFLVGADGQNLKRMTTNTFEWDEHPSWSPDGAKPGVLVQSPVRPSADLGHKRGWHQSGQPEQKRVRRA